MSQYITVDGYIEYADEAAFQLAVAVLRRGFWIDDEGWFIDENGEQIGDEPSVDDDNWIIEIPRAYYRNLGSVLDEILFGSTHHIVWTSTDGCFDGGVIIDGKEQTCSLERFARKWMPDEDKRPPDPEIDPEEYLAWQERVEIMFLAKYVGPDELVEGAL